jgi:hypothetical protein
LDGRLPDLIIGGAPRSGTTFLCHVLDRHPEVCVAKPFIPEPKVCMTPSKDGVAGYRARYAELFTSARPDQVLVEKTSYYLENEQALERLRQTLPACRFAFIVREPIARAYSNYLWSRKNGLEKLSFREALALEGRRQSPLPAEQAYARPFDYLSRGNYGLFARRYIEAFGRPAVAFFLYEDIERDPAGLYEGLRVFCGIGGRPDSMTDVGVVNPTEESAIPLSREELATLRGKVQPWVDDFAAVSGLDLHAWGY